MKAVDDLVSSLQKEVQSFELISKRRKMEKVGVTGLKFKILLDDENDEAVLGQKLKAWIACKRKCKNKKGWCCASHCSLTGHNSSDKCLTIPSYSFPDQCEFPSLLDRSWIDDETYEDVTQSCYFSMGLTSLISSVNMDLSDDFFDDD